MNPVSRKWTLRLLGCSTFLAVALGLFSNMLADFACKVPPVAHPNISPETVGLSAETVFIQSNDHLKLAAWWIPAPGKTAVVVVHGLGAGKDFMLNYMLLAHHEGHPVLAIDLRGHGESDSSPTSLGYHEAEDIHSWIDYLEKQGFAHPIIWGTSLGAASLLREAATDSRPSGLIADAPFDTLRHSLAIHGKLFFGLPEYPFIPLTVWQIERKLHFRVADINTLQEVKQIHSPLLILAAEKDQRMPLPTVEQIYETANSPKSLWIIPGADHETRTFHPDFCQTVKTFMQSVTPKI